MITSFISRSSLIHHANISAPLYWWYFQITVCEPMTKGAACKYASYQANWKLQAQRACSYTHRTHLHTVKKHISQDLSVQGKTLSRVSTSLPKRLTKRPMGFVSKNCTGKCMTLQRMSAWSLALASRAPNDRVNAPNRMARAEGYIYEKYY